MTRRSTVAMAATAALGVTAMAGTALAQGGSTSTAKIVAKGSGETMRFAPAILTVHSGDTVTFVNKIKKEPHTLSLIKPSALPKTEKDMKACENPRGKSACAPLFKAHKVNFKTFAIGRPLYDAKGDGGFATMGTKKKAGDSVYVDPGATVTFKVTARAGKTLTYFCAVHPWMNGQIKVVK